jgi:N6-L-threonylcarbamoyladenine synthase
MKTVLAIETSCDETAVAILRGDELLASEVASQIKEHERYGGVVPEVAARNHLLHAPRLLRRALESARISLGAIDAFAATAGPGLASSLMIGASIAKGLALGHGKPYLAINHLEGHLLSPFLWPGSASPATTRAGVEPNVSLVVSGGHTLLIEVRGLNDYRVLGRTVDDAAGEAFDKVAKMLGLGYPGGPEIERRARRGDPTRYDLPRSMLDSRDHDFSFSGLKTAVRYLLPILGLRAHHIVIPSESEGPRKRSSDIARSFARKAFGAQDDRVVDDVCASFQQAVIDVLVQKTLRAAREAGAKMITLSGGVSCNRELREQMRIACEGEGLKFLAAAPELCTDNAAMIAFVASLRLQRGLMSRVDEDIDPNLALA